MAVMLHLRHLAGAPRSWRFGDHEEPVIRMMLAGLKPFQAPVATRAAVLVAREEDGSLIGAWNRRGTRALTESIQVDTLGPQWIDVYAALDAAVPRG
jgi:hypothetical protein